jgi:hypothetical protein
MKHTTGDKGEFLRVRVSPEMLKALQQAAERDRRSVSDWVRLRLEEALKKGTR